MFRPLATGMIEKSKHRFYLMHTRQKMEWRMNMINQPTKFDPDYVATLRRILDIAVESIAEENRTPATKAKMAQQHVGVLLQQVVLSDMLDCCCWPGN